MGDAKHGLRALARYLTPIGLRLVRGSVYVQKVLAERAIYDLVSSVLDSKSIRTMRFYARQLDRQLLLSNPQSTPVDRLYNCEIIQKYNSTIGQTPHRVLGSVKLRNTRIV